MNCRILVRAGGVGTLAIVLLTLWVGTAAGDALQAGQAYAGGTRVESSSTGVCADGQFAYFGDSTITLNVPGATASSGGRGGLRGQWAIDAATPGSAVLVLQGDDGRQLRWPVRYDGQKTFLNGQRWLRAKSDACR